MQTIVELARNLGLRAVAEGIETEEAYRLLAALRLRPTARASCSRRPMPPDDVVALALASRRERRRGSTPARAG